MYKARAASPSIKPGPAPQPRVSLAPGLDKRAAAESSRHLLISDREDGTAAFVRTSVDSLAPCVSVYHWWEGGWGCADFKFSSFQLLIIALVWVSIAQRRRNNLITTNKINKKV